MARSYGVVALNLMAATIPILPILSDCIELAAKIFKPASRLRKNQRITAEDTKGTEFLLYFYSAFSAIAPALLNHRDVANAENAGAVFCLPPASMQFVRVLCGE